MNRKKQIIEILAISLIVSIVFCVPFLSGMINIGSDTCFHMNRIEALRTAIANGDYYPYIFHYQNYYFGYALPIFYSDIFLYPAAVLSAFLSVYNTWVIYVGMIIFLSSFSIQYVFVQIKENPKFSSKLFVAFLYVMNYAVLTRAFKRGAIGELLALIFVPLVILNIKRVIYDKENSWIKLGISFTLLLLAHNITFITASIVFFFIIVIRIKNVIKNRLYIPIFKAVLLAIMLSSFYLLPMFEQLSIGIYNINYYFDNEVYSSKITDLLTIKMNGFGGYHENSVLIACLIIPMFLMKNKKYRWLAITGLIITFVSTNLVPWQSIPLIGFVQFTHRLLILSMPFLAISCGIVTNDISNKNLISKTVIYLTLIASAITAFYGLSVLKNDLYGAINKETTEHDIADVDSLLGYHKFYNSLELSSPEYLPTEEFDYYNFHWQMYTFSEKSLFSLSQYNYNSAEYVITISKDDYDYVYPKTYYKGYVVEVYDENNNYLETLNTRIFENKFVTCRIPEKYSGLTIITKVKYKGTTIQKVSLLVSMVSFCLTGLFLPKTRKKQIYSQQA